MRGGRPGLALEPLRTLFGAGTAAGLSDAQLLERFSGRRTDDDAEAAFAALVAAAWADGAPRLPIAGRRPE